MILRLTKRLADKVSEGVKECAPRHENPLADWAANMFRVQGTQYVIVTNCASLYTIAFYGRGITDGGALIQRFFDNLRETVNEKSGESTYEDLIMPHTGRVSFSKVGDRSVLGSMNDLALHVKHHATRNDMAPFDMAERLNMLPMKTLEYCAPREMFRELLLAGRRMPED